MYDQDGDDLRSSFTTYLAEGDKVNSLITHIGKSRKQNPKIGFFTERHFRKQNPTQISADDDVTCLKYFW